MLKQVSLPQIPVPTQDGPSLYVAEFIACSEVSDLPAWPGNQSNVSMALWATPAEGYALRVKRLVHDVEEDAVTLESETLSFATVEALLRHLEEQTDARTMVGWLLQRAAERDKAIKLAAAQLASKGGL